MDECPTWIWLITPSGLAAPIPMSEWQPCVEPNCTRLAIGTPMSVTRVTPPGRSISPHDDNPLSKETVVESTSQPNRSNERDTGDIPADLNTGPSHHRSERAKARSAPGPSPLGRMKLPGKVLLTSARDLQDYTAFHSYRVRERPFGEWKPMLVGGRQLGKVH